MMWCYLSKYIQHIRIYLCFCVVCILYNNPFNTVFTTIIPISIFRFICIQWIQSFNWSMWWRWIIHFDTSTSIFWYMILRTSRNCSSYYFLSRNVTRHYEKHCRILVLTFWTTVCLNFVHIIIITIVIITLKLTFSLIRKWIVSNTIF